MESSGVAFAAIDACETDEVKTAAVECYEGPQQAEKSSRLMFTVEDIECRPQAAWNVRQEDPVTVAAIRLPEGKQGAEAIKSLQQSGVAAEVINWTTDTLVLALSGGYCAETYSLLEQSGLAVENRGDFVRIRMQGGWSDDYLRLLGAMETEWENDGFSQVRLYGSDAVAVLLVREERASGIVALLEASGLV